MNKSKNSQNHSKEILKIFGVKPNEKFKIKGKDGVYMIDEELNVLACFESCDSGIYPHLNSELQLILNGNHEIVKIPRLTEADKHAITFLKDWGYKFSARDKYDEEENLFAYKNMPNRHDYDWDDISGNDANFLLLPKELFSFLKWEDEPLEISNIEV